MRNVFSITNVPKLRSFQYRLLQKAVVTNRHLVLWKILDNPSCSFCNEEIETYSHLFCDCRIVSEFWTQTMQWIENNLNEKVIIDAKRVIFNDFSPRVKNVVNLISLIAKQYIYRQRCCGKAIVFKEFTNIVQETKNYEKYYAIKSDKVIQHNKKWKEKVPTNTNMNNTNTS